VIAHCPLALPDTVIPSNARNLLFIARKKQIPRPSVSE